MKIIIQRRRSIVVIHIIIRQYDFRARKVHCIYRFVPVAHRRGIRNFSKRPCDDAVRVKRQSRRIRSRSIIFPDGGGKSNSRSDSFDYFLRYKYNERLGFYIYIYIFTNKTSRSERINPDRFHNESRVE